MGPIEQLECLLDRETQSLSVGERLPRSVPTQKCFYRTMHGVCKGQLTPARLIKKLAKQKGLNIATLSNFAQIA